MIKNNKFWTLIDRLEYFGVLLLIALTPIMLQNVYTSPFQVEWLRRVQPVDLFFIPLFVIWLVGTIRNPSRLRRVPLKTPLLIYVAAIILSVVHAGGMEKGMIEVLITAYLIALYFIVATVLNNEQCLLRALRIWLLTAIAVTAVGLIGYAVAVATSQENFFAYIGRDMPIFWRSFRIRSSFQPTSKLFSTYMLLTIPLVIIYCIDLCRTFLTRWLIGVVGVFMVIATVLTLSRHVFALFVEMGLLLIFCMRRVPTPKRKKLLGFAAIAFTVIGVSGVFADQAYSSFHIASVKFLHGSDPANMVHEHHYYSADPKRGLETVSLSVDYVYGSYYWAKRGALWMFTKHPLVGIGEGGFGKYYKVFMDEIGLPKDMVTLASAHNQLLNSLSETGILGASALVVLWICVFRSLVLAYRRPLDNRGMSSLALNKAFLIGFVGLMIASLNLDFMNFRFVWLALGIAMSSV